MLTDLHYDANDLDNSLCVIVPLGEFEGGELVFPKINLVVELKRGNIIYFQSKKLLHGNISASGIRYSLVFFNHKNCFPTN